MNSNHEKQERPTKGRPRDFDPEIALERAMNAFWEFGYETTSMAMLSKAMKLSAPSIYAAFGNKEQLFHKAVHRYLGKVGVDLGVILDKAPTAREGIETCLRLLARRYTEGETRGCMVASSATTCSPDAKGIQDFLRHLRKTSEQVLQDGIASGVNKGELPAGTDPAGLAKYYAAIIQGMSLQAQDGSSCPELLAIAENAMKAWPER